MFGMRGLYSIVLGAGSTTDDSALMQQQMANFVPVNRSCSRNAHNRGVCGSISNACSSPFTLNLIISTFVYQTEPML